MLQDPTTRLWLLALADGVQLFTVVLSIVAFIPQILKLITEKNSTGLAVRSWLLWTLGSAMALFYALVHFIAEHSCLTLTITASINFGLNLSTLVLIRAYQPRSPGRTAVDPVTLTPSSDLTLMASHALAGSRATASTPPDR